MEVLNGYEPKGTQVFWRDGAFVGYLVRFREPLGRSTRTRAVVKYMGGQTEVTVHADALCCDKG